MFSFPVPVKDLGERPLGRLMSGALLVYAWMWFFAVVNDAFERHRYPMGPARWALYTLASHGVDAPTWLGRLLLEPHPNVFLLVIPAVLVNWLNGAPYGIRILLLLLSIQWCGVRSTGVAYAIAAAVVAVICAGFAFYAYRQNKAEYTKDAGEFVHPALLGVFMFAEPFVYPFLMVPFKRAMQFVTGVYFDDRRKSRLRFVVLDELRSKPLAEATALDLANAIWLSHQAEYKPVRDNTDQEKFEKWWGEVQRRDELEENLARRAKGRDLPDTRAIVRHS
ncbi:hypothetical protein [Mycobacteroides abscessus]|uniref:hypothetical protein n=1 Tax=Mycobacteroides abscessus TaxID=36809 RepID=UPI00266FCE89|nr:hypothetical protein [Mycobacteroides abscessus]MDO3110003.1 hypothetical protein [Mycobacteroides abscessus subsp. abscessus]